MNDLHKDKSFTNASENTQKIIIKSFQKLLLIVKP